LKDDTLWVMKNSQLQNAIIKAKKLEVCEEEISEYKNQISLHKQKDAEQDSLIKILTKDRDYYMNTWNICEQDIQKLGRMQKRQKLYTKLALAGIPVAFVIGLFIKL
jgi:Flp pilus assembly protein TadB